MAIKHEGVDPVQERKKVNQNPFKTLNDLYADYYQLRQRDIANGYGDKPPRPTIPNDVIRMLKRIFDHGIKLNVTQFNPASPFRPRDAGGEEQAANDGETNKIVDFDMVCKLQFSRQLLT